MTDHTTMPRVSRLEVITTGARRRWTREEKLRIVAESFSVPRSASATARRHGLSTGQLFSWRKQVREGRLDAGEDGGFAPVLVVPEAREVPDALVTPPTPAPSMPAVATAGRMEISVGDARVVVDASVDGAALARVLKVLRRR